MMDSFEWTCPHCNKDQIVTESNYCERFTIFEIGETCHGDVGINITAIRCSNRNCLNITISGALKKYRYLQMGIRPSSDDIYYWLLMPESNSKTQPDYIPLPIREDYYEACKIRDKSPKAAATLARRCIQGMIRDFCGISKNRLIDEIKELRAQIDKGSAPKGVEAETIDAIDAVRSVGNIGAHMEKDISLIVDVDPGEAKALIELIEMLFDDWYVARHNRVERLARIQAIAADKNRLITDAKSGPRAEKLAITDQTTKDV